MQKKTFEKWKVTSIEAIREEARILVVRLGDGRPLGDTYERMCWRAATATGLPFARLWGYFYRKIKRPPADEIDVLRARWEDVQRRKRLAGLEDGIAKFDRDGDAESDRRAQALRSIDREGGVSREQAPALFD